MADSQLILELLFLQRRGGCSLTVLLFFLMLVGICCFILSASLCVVRPTYRALMKHYQSMAISGRLGISLDQTFFLLQSWLVFD